MFSLRPEKSESMLTAVLSPGLVVAPYGQAWKEHRQFTLSTLRNFGLGKKSMEERISEESSFLIQEFEKNKGHLCVLCSCVVCSVLLLLCVVVYGGMLLLVNPSPQGARPPLRPAPSRTHSHNCRVSLQGPAQNEMMGLSLWLKEYSKASQKSCIAAYATEIISPFSDKDKISDMCRNNICLPPILRSLSTRGSQDSVHFHGGRASCARYTLTDPHFAIDNAVSNIICSIVFGRRYDYDDSTFRDVLNLVHENMRMVTGIWAQLYNAFGFIHYLPLPHRKIFRNVDKVFGFLGNVLDEHRKSRQPGEPRDYIDCYLEELDKEEQHNGKKTFDIRNLFTCMADLFVAGTETTSASLEWCLLYMMAFPDVQEKCRNEIDKVRGDRERLNYEDRVSMPYTQAVLQEVQRFASVVPLGVSHASLEDEQLNGFTIPKGTIIITDLSSLNYDETYWKYPHEFNPENFLNNDGELIKAEAFLPFSAGPRVCLGENLARMEIFLFFTTLLTHFEFQWPDPASTPDLTPVFGVSQAPKRFKIRLVSKK
ncbi:cytochrome P450 2J6-like [Pelobates cultripes]|uniref:Cytochrome P450 2J6-like n=1 Tax=Pelobates cultripes TaxID=61616 RepID=A0AAD1WQN6_PELCU|nr:cytochrome P450 2J6-like [Pelobates cultripes]